MGIYSLNHIRAYKSIKFLIKMSKKNLTLTVRFNVKKNKYSIESNIKNKEEQIELINELLKTRKNDKKDLTEVSRTPEYAITITRYKNDRIGVHDNIGSESVRDGILYYFLQSLNSKGYSVKS